MRALNPVIVIGSGVWLELACAWIAAPLRHFGMRVVAVVLPSEPAESRSTQFGPALTELCEHLACTPLSLIQQVQGHVSLGCHYQFAARQGFIPYGFYGLQAEASEFEQVVLHCLRESPALANTISIDALSVAAQAALQQKFAIAPNTRPDLQQALAFGGQMDSVALAACLHQHNLAAGVIYHACASLVCVRNTQGIVETIKTDNGYEQSVHFLIDCRRSSDVSSHASAATPALQQPFALRLWADSRPEQLSPYSSAIQLSGSWVVKHRLADREHWQCLLQQPPATVALVLAELQQKTGIADWQQVRFPVPKGMDNPWQGNVLRCGEAAAVLDQPLYDGVSALSFMLPLWLALLPGQAMRPAAASLFNTQWQLFQQEVHMYLQCHTEPLATAQGQLFARAGRLLPAETDAILPAQWFGLLVGLGLRPALPSILLATRSTSELFSAVHQIQHSIARLVSGMPSYTDFLALTRNAV